MHSTFFFCLKGFSTGVEMTERELDEFLYCDLLPYPAAVFPVFGSNDMTVNEMKTCASCCYLALLAVSVYDHL